MGWFSSLLLLCMLWAPRAHTPCATLNTPPAYGSTYFGLYPPDNDGRILNQSEKVEFNTNDWLQLQKLAALHGDFGPALVPILRKLASGKHVRIGMVGGSMQAGSGCKQPYLPTFAGDQQLNMPVYMSNAL